MLGLGNQFDESMQAQPTFPVPGAVRLVARGRISSDASSQAKPAQLGPYPYRLAELVG